MRILRLRFRNLNSLVGEWEIDFTAPAFASDGIFAITGPTGAGKTTILDAICLALYGRTPRLDRVTHSGNEILSRQTGECFAEVTFENQKGRYRCHWSQRRAHKKPDGQLQQPNHEIADARNGKVLATKIKEVAERIEAITGMDFDRFTRAMLLAQGSFAAFLQAGPDDRAPILEQITGTEIYSRISTRVHERRREENEKRQSLQAELEGMQLLDEEAEERLNSQLTEKSEQAEALSREIKNQEQAIAWLDVLTDLTRKLGQIEEQKETWRQRNQAFEPQRQRLGRANQALQLEGDYSVLISLREEQKKDRRTLSEHREKLPRAGAEVEASRQQHRQAETKWQETKQALNDGLPMLQQVRELDVQICERVAPIEQLGTELESRQKRFDELTDQRQRDAGELEHKRKTLEDLLQRLEASSADEVLTERLAGLKERFETLRQLQSQLTAKLKDIGQAEVEQTQATKALQEKSQALQHHRQEQERLQKGLTRLQETLGKTLEGRDLAGWTTLLAGLAERKSQLERAMRTLQDLHETQEGLADLEQAGDKLQADRAERAQQLESRIERKDALQREADLLQEKAVLLDRIQSLEEMRRQLRDGEPCPLCGATDHPYARGNVPVPDETRQRLEQVNAELRQAGDEVTRLKIRLAELDKDIDNNAADRRTHHRDIDEFRQALVETGGALEVDLSGDEARDLLKTLQQENAARIDHARRVIEEAGTLEKQIRDQRQRLEEAGIHLRETEKQAQAAGHRKETAENQLERLGRERNELQGRLDGLLEALKAEVSAFGIDDLTPERLDDIEDRLTRRRDLWLAGEREKGELEKDIATLETQVRHQQEQINGIQKDIGRQRQTLAALVRERDNLKDKRRRLFGDRDPQAEEKRLTAAVEAAEKELKSTQQRLNDAARALELLKNTIGELEKRLEARKDKLLTREEAFHARLRALDFVDETDFEKAGLAEEERQSLEKQAQTLQREITELEAREKDVRKKLEDESRKKVTDLPREELERQRETLATDLKTLQEATGAIRHQLEQNERLKRQCREKVQAIEAQKKECDRWNLLHDLIGSSDGKKFRLFAQGLTFEMLIGHANQQLQKMTDRYLLIRDDAQALALAVIDNYQAGEKRSTRNLSGGESFIVSLALALGLSSMASHKVRVDSLFLDEGFGTLDEEALETALDTLAELRQDGKLIGLISHVPALKERIGTQIQVIPRVGGRSEIQGPDCRRLA